jgi:uncharacterized membrane protein
MDELAEKLAKWFGSAPFILFHIVWFTTWIIFHFTIGFDEEWATLTFVVSLEAIFLSLFILRAENVASEREEKNLRKDLRVTKDVSNKLDKLRQGKRA